MSFSREIKSELAKLQPKRKCCRIAQVSAIMHMDGTLHIHGREKLSIDISTENAAVARLVYKFLSEEFNLLVDSIVRKSVLHKVNNYLIQVPDQLVLSQVLNEFGILDDHMLPAQGIMHRVVKRDCCAVAYLRGAFLGGGFVSDPKGDYHFELTTNNSEFARDLQLLINRFELHSKISDRKKNFAVYMKDSNEIITFLAMIGAYNALLKWEDERIIREMRGQVNRLVNCDTANLNKAVSAAANQIEDIQAIDQLLGLHNLPEGLQEFARLRVEYPYVSLKELGELFNPPLSKSAVNHRARRIIELAKKLRRPRNVSR
ncbi:MAG: DNA-binding protein WhiA [Rubrobacteridae bacterium]|nr:DNA-binding protein WhiA [Rubrobacteridae bacterium]